MTELDGERAIMHSVNFYNSKKLNYGIAGNYYKSYLKDIKINIHE